MSSRSYLDQLKKKYNCNLNTLGKKYGINPNTLNTLYTQNGMMSSTILEAIAKEEGLLNYEVLYLSLVNEWKHSAETLLYLCKMICEDYSVNIFFDDQDKEEFRKELDPYHFSYEPYDAFDGSIQKKRTGNGYSVVKSWNDLEKDTILSIYNVDWLEDMLDVNSDKIVNPEQIIRIPKVEHTKYIHKSGKEFLDLEMHFYGSEVDPNSLDWENLDPEKIDEYASDPELNRPMTPEEEKSFVQYYSGQLHEERPEMTPEEEESFFQYHSGEQEPWTEEDEERLEHILSDIDEFEKSDQWLNDFEKESVYIEQFPLRNINWYKKNYTTTQGNTFQDFYNKMIRDGYIKNTLDIIVPDKIEVCNEDNDKKIINYILVFNDIVLKEAVEKTLERYKHTSKPRIRCEYVEVKENFQPKRVIKIDKEVTDAFNNQFIPFVKEQSFENEELYYSFSKEALIHLIEAIDDPKQLGQFANLDIEMSDQRLKNYLIQFFKAEETPTDIHEGILENLHIIATYMHQLNIEQFNILYWDLLPFFNLYREKNKDPLYSEDYRFFYQPLDNGKAKIVNPVEAGLEPRIIEVFKPFSFSKPNE